MNDPCVESVEELSSRVLDLRQSISTDERLMIAICGAPGSGKSTLAQHLVDQLNASLSGTDEGAVVVPMDGFHFDNAVLDQHGTRAIKGSPQTFDVGGFLALIHRLCIRTEQSVYVPVFDRDADLARNAAQAITNEHTIVIVEGNYLLLQQEPWCELKSLFRCNIMLEVPFDILEQRLVQRWLDYGHTEAQARLRAESNDLPNARLVADESARAHLYYKSMRQ